MIIISVIALQPVALAYIMPLCTVVQLFIVRVTVRVIIRLHLYFGLHISRNLTRFARVITAIIKFAPLEL